MSIKFDLSITTQSTIFFDNIKVKAYKKLINFSRKHTHAARFLGLPIFLCSSLLDLAQVVSTIGESLIKGIANIFGSPFSEKCHFSKGIKQIFLQIPLHILSNVISLPLLTAYNTLATPIKMAISPTEELESKKEAAEGTKDLFQDLDSLDFDLSKCTSLMEGMGGAAQLLIKNMYS